MRHSEEPAWKGAVAAGLSRLPSMFFVGSAGWWFSVVHLPVSLLAGFPFALDLRAHHRPQEGHRPQAAARWGEWHCCLQELCLGSLSAGRLQVPLRASPASGSTWHCSPNSFPYHGRNNVIISETGKFLLSRATLPFCCPFHQGSAAEHLCDCSS